MVGSREECERKEGREGEAEEEEEREHGRNKERGRKEYVGGSGGLKEDKGCSHATFQTPNISKSKDEALKFRKNITSCFRSLLRSRIHRIAADLLNMGTYLHLVLTCDPYLGILSG